MKDFFNRHFHLDEHGTSVRTEVIAGITTFATNVAKKRIQSLMKNQIWILYRIMTIYMLHLCQIFKLILIKKICTGGSL